MKAVKEIRKQLEGEQAPNATKRISAWNRAVVNYALELIEGLEDGEEITEKRLLNGAKNWREFSWGGCSLVYNCDIARRTCTPSELKKTDNGNRKPNAREEWLDVQARALHQASRRIMEIAKEA